ncbi:hypothetical protein [Actinomyces sp. Marseille-P3109]|jgi:hypothetical protein avisC_01092|uniref:hypothetical protein n=1 Tax=Actinomyces sp. Marseille-P3109 TaxID=2083009 RepID=UPI000D55E7E1|nr:hypothetical protein [Actinomyces sp. Marseille-P3109]
MALSRTRVVNALIGLLVLTVVALAVVPCLVPRTQETPRNRFDSDIVLTGDVARDCSVASDEAIDRARPSPPVDIQHRADLTGAGVSIVFASIAVIAVVLSRRNRAHLTRCLAWLPFGGAFALMIGVVWGYTVGNASIQDHNGDAMNCLGERLTSLDSRLIPFLNRDCVTQSRIDVLAALLAAVVFVLIEYRILLSLRQRTEGVNLPGKP